VDGNRQLIERMEKKIAATSPASGGSRLIHCPQSMGIRMANLNDNEIGVDDLNGFLNDRSDFAFELRVLKTLRDLGFECQHGVPMRTRTPQSFGSLIFVRRLSWVTRSCT